MVQIEDKHGKMIMVTHLPEAMELTDYFGNFAHADAVFELFDWER
jgi:hypothetical protein